MTTLYCYHCLSEPHTTADEAVSILSGTAYCFKHLEQAAIRLAEMADQARALSAETDALAKRFGAWKGRRQAGDPPGRTQQR